MTYIDYPYRVDGRGRTATTDRNDHIRDMIEQFLFTSPGERVNRPEFGGGLLRQVFEPNSTQHRDQLQLLVQAGLHDWLGDLIEVQELSVTDVDSTLAIVLSYLVRETGDVRRDTIRIGRQP
jgi:uncharacterized protein